MTGPEEWRHETIWQLRAGGWSWEGIARIYNVTVPGAKLLAGEPDWHAGGQPSFTCPRCGLASYHPDDIREGYCGHCHDWTGQR